MNRKKFSKLQKENIYITQKGICDICRKRVLFSEITLDHIILLSKRGSNSIINIQIAHWECNQRKGNKFIRTGLIIIT